MRKLYTSCGSPQPAISLLEGYCESRPQYLRRPHEQAKFDTRFSSKLLPVRYLNYVNEDIVHNSEVVAHAIYLSCPERKCRVQEVFFNEKVYHRYFLLDDIDYPCVNCGDNTVNVLMVSAREFHYKNIDENIIESAARESLDSYLARNNRVLLPLIWRHNDVDQRYVSVEGDHAGNECGRCIALHDPYVILTMRYLILDSYDQASCKG